MSFLDFLFGAYIVLLPVQFEAGIGRLAPSDLFILALAVLGFKKIRLIPAAWSALHWALLGMFVVGTALAATRNGLLTNYVLINKDFGIVLLLLAYAITTSRSRTWDDVRRFLRLFVISTALNSAVSVFALLLTATTGSHALSAFLYLDGRAAGLLVDPNAFGGLLIVALTVQVSTYFSPRPVLAGTSGFVAILALGLGVVFTLSRSAWIGFSAATLLLLMLRPRLLLAYVAAAGMGFAALFVFLGPSRLSTIFKVANRPNTTQQRLDQITQALPMIADTPFFGSGIGSFIQKNGWILHDTTFWILTEFGFVGLTIFIAFVSWYFVTGLRAYRSSPEEQRPILAGLLGAHLGMLAVSFGIEAFYQRHWWLVMSLIATANGFTVQRHYRRSPGGLPADGTRPGAFAVFPLAPLQIRRGRS